MRGLCRKAWGFNSPPAHQKIINDFDNTVPGFYSEKDRKKGFIVAKDRKGQEQKITLLSISIGVVTNEFRKIEHVAQIGEIGAELKTLAKDSERSNYVKDRRTADRRSDERKA